MRWKPGRSRGLGMGLGMMYQIIQELSIEM